jgi:flagellar hook protein FlgE
VPSIINGLFAGRSGIASHGVAIAVVGDNIANSSTVGYKSSRSEFQDLIAGGQTSGKVIGSGSSLSAVTTNFEQGTLEFTGKPLDLAVDGSGFFVVADGEQRFYTRAGNFKTDSAGFIIDQSGKAVLGFPGTDGTGDLEPLNINSISQSSVATQNLSIAGNLNASATAISAATIPQTISAGANPATDTFGTTYSDLNDAAEFSTVVNVFDPLGAKHTATFFFFKTATNTWQGRGYVNSEEVDPSGAAVSVPRQIGSTVTLSFNPDGTRSNAPATGAADFTASVPWNNGSTTTLAPQAIDISFDPFSQYSSASNVLSINQDGQGIGTVSSVDIGKDGRIFALLSNGQSALIGTIGLVNFANPEGLSRIGNSLLQQSSTSGEPIIGRPQTGTLGDIQSGSIELSTVDIANEFVKLITLQRGFQASSRMITTINQLLNDIIQLA